MNSKLVIAGQALVTGVVPMLLAALVARVIGPEVLESDAAMTVIAACGYAGVALYLLAHGGKLGLEVRLRLAMSMVAIGVIPWALAFIAGSFSAAMGLLAFATLASLPLLLAGVSSLMSCAAAAQSRDKSDVHALDISFGFAVLLWNLLVPVQILDIFVEGYNMTQPMKWLGTAMLFNSCIYLWSCVRGFVILFVGGIGGLLEAFGGATSSARHGSSAPSDASPDINPTTGFEMEGAIDQGGYTYGEDPGSRDHNG